MRLLLRETTPTRRTPEWLLSDDKKTEFVITEADRKGPQVALTNSRLCQRLPLCRGPLRNPCRICLFAAIYPGIIYACTYIRQASER
jgi:hypothetical protein